ASTLPSEAWQIIEEMILPHNGWAGGRIHDAIHLRCAQKARCDRICPFNVKDFRALAPVRPCRYHFSAVKPTKQSNISARTAYFSLLSRKPQRPPSGSRELPAAAVRALLIPSHNEHAVPIRVEAIPLPDGVPVGRQHKILSAQRADHQ